jgi:hypothetical protein
MDSIAALYPPWAPPWLCSHDALLATTERAVRFAPRCALTWQMRAMVYGMWVDGPKGQRESAKSYERAAALSATPQNEMFRRLAENVRRGGRVATEDKLTD